MKISWINTFYINSLKNKEQTFIGILTPINWDKNGRVKKFSIYSENSEDILIEGHPQMKKLKSLLKKRVLAKGQIRIDKNGVKHIKLISIKEIKNSTSPMKNRIRSMELSPWSEEYPLSIPWESQSKFSNGF